jgi:hypothetical protein
LLFSDRRQLLDGKAGRYASLRIVAFSFGLLSGVEQMKNIDIKRQKAASKIKEVAQHIDSLINMLDETKIDLLLIALSGATVSPDDLK